MTSKNDQKVAVAYPHPGTLPAKFARCLLNLWRWDAFHKRRILDGGAHIERSTAILLRARTDIVRDFMKLDADWLFMVDTDMTFDPDIVDRLVEAAHPTLRPVVGGLCFAYMADQSRKFWPTLFSWVPGTTQLRRLTQYPADTLVPVAATGAACLLVHRSVLEAMQQRFGGPRPWFAEQEIEPCDEYPNGDVLSEDITFCLRAQACGFPVYVHTGIKTGHLKQFEVDEGLFVEESAALQEARMPALPTFAVIASKNRPEMLATLRRQLEGQVHKVIVYDNGYDAHPTGSVSAHDWPLHRMWNHGLDLAKSISNSTPHNVLIINDDVEVPNELCAVLEAGLRSDDDNWISYPDADGQIPPGVVAERTNPTLAGQTMTGWCFMLRGEAGLRFDEQFEFWYGDSDLERQVREAGKRAVCVGGSTARHLDPMRSTMTDPVRLAQAEADEKRFAAKWGIDPDTLWLARQKVTA